MPGAIYGNDFSSLQGGITADASLRQRGLESALAGAVQSIQQMKNRQMLADQFAKTMAQQGQRLQVEKDHYKSIAQQASDTLELNSQKFESEKKYQDWIMNQDTPTQQKERDLSDRYIIHLGEQGQILDKDHARELAKNASDTAINVAVQTSKMAQASQEKEFQLANNLANKMTMQSDRDSKIAALKAENTKLNEPWITGWSGNQKIKQNNELIKQLTAEREEIARGLKPFQDNKLIDRLVLPSMSSPGAFESAVPVPYHIQKGASPLSGTLSAGTPASVAGNPTRSLTPVAAAGRRPTFTPAPAMAQESTVSPGLRVTNDMPVTATSTATQGAGDQRSWVARRAQELHSMGRAKTVSEAIDQARQEWQATQ